MAIRLLIDEDVRPLPAETLRQRGFDARHVDELKRSGLSDAEQLAFAVKQRRAVLTHNIRDYVLLDREYRTKRQPHYGILVCDQVPFRELLRRTVRCLGDNRKWTSATASFGSRILSSREPLVSSQVWSSSDQQGSPQPPASPAEWLAATATRTHGAESGP